MYAKEYVTFEFLLVSVRIKFYYKYFEYQNFVKQQFLYTFGIFFNVIESNQTK